MNQNNTRRTRATMATRLPLGAIKTGDENQTVHQAVKKIGATGTTATAVAKSGLLNKQAVARKRTALGDLSNKNAKSSNNKVTKKRSSTTRGKSAATTASTAAATTTAATAIAAAAKMNAIVDKKTDATVRTQPSAQPGIKNIARPRPTTKPVDTKQAPVSVPVAAKAAVATTTTTTTTVKEEKEAAKTVCSADPAPVAKPAPVVSEPAVEVKEAEPTWAELDAEDIDDPLMVSEYVEEIFEYMRELEIKTMPNPRYMTQQKELQWNMRGILVDWLIDVHNRFQLLPETLFLTVNLIDRFLSQRVVSLVKLQLVGITAMFIASKYEEVMAPSIQNFIYMADDGYKEEEVLRAERYMLQVLDFDLSTPNPLNFLRRISKADDYDVQTRTVAKYLMEIPLVDHRLIDQPWSKISAAAMLLARKMLNRGAWDANFVHYSYYQEEELLDIVDIMEDYLGGTVKHESLYKKYGDAKFFKASRYVREWVRKNVTAGPV